MCIEAAGEKGNGQFSRALYHFCYKTATALAVQPAPSLADVAELPLARAAGLEVAQDLASAFDTLRAASCQGWAISSRRGGVRQKYCSSW